MYYGKKKETGKFIRERKIPHTGDHWISWRVQIVALIPKNWKFSNKSMSCVMCQLSPVTCHTVGRRAYSPSPPSTAGRQGPSLTKILTLVDEMIISWQREDVAAIYNPKCCRSPHAVNTGLHGTPDIQVRDAMNWSEVKWAVMLDENLSRNA